MAAQTYWVVASGATGGSVVSSLGGGGGGKNVQNYQTFASAGYTIPNPTTSYNVTHGIATGNCPFALPAASVDDELWIVHQQPPTGGPYTPTFPANVNWVGNQAPVWSTNGYSDRIHLLCIDGVNWEGDVSSGFFGSPLIEPVGTGYSALPSSTNTWTLSSVDALTIGDIWMIEVANYSGATVTGVSGGGVTTWSILGNEPHASGAVECSALLYGVITTAGVATITIAMSANAGGEVIAQEFSNLLPGGAFSVANAGSGVNGGTSSTAIDFPSLTPSAPNQMYIASFYQGGGAFTSVTPGYTAGNGNGFLMNLNCPATAQAPVATMSANAFAAWAALIEV